MTRMNVTPLYKADILPSMRITCHKTPEHVLYMYIWAYAYIRDRRPFECRQLYQHLKYLSSIPASMQLITHALTCDCSLDFEATPEHSFKSSKRIAQKSNGINMHTYI